MPRGFFSYSHKDDMGFLDEFCKSLIKFASIEASQEVPIFFDRENHGLSNLDDELEKNIREADFYIIVISDNYFQKGRTSLAEFRLIDKLLAEQNNRRALVIEWRKLSNASIGILNRSQSVGSIQRAPYHDGWKRPLEDFKSSIVPHLPKLLLSRPLESKEPEPSTEDIQDLADRIVPLAKSTNQHAAVRNKLIANILEDVISELETLNKEEYRHEISLDHNFIRRAEAIFEEASEIYAVSLDAASSFWLNKNTIESARKYTNVQPKNTFRLFVFSTPGSMLKHRNVLAEHWDRYGETGRVIMTSRDDWSLYMEECLPSGNKIALDEDFGVLKYKFQDTQLLATLGNSSLQFRHIESQSTYDGFVSDLQKEAETFETSEGPYEALSFPANDPSPRFWLWKPEFRKHDDAWFGCVRSVFNGDIDFGPKYTSNIMHSVLLAPPGNSRNRKFEEFMKVQVGRILSIRDEDGERLVRGIWFGERYQDEEIPRDGVFQNPLVFSEFWQSKWRYCLTMSFDSADSCQEYYRSSIHSDIRRDLFLWMDPSVEDLYNEADQFQKEKKTEIASSIGFAIEQMMAKYILRLDYSVPDQYNVYKAIEAPNF